MRPELDALYAEAQRCIHRWNLLDKTDRDLLVAVIKALEPPNFSNMPTELADAVAAAE